MKRLLCAVILLFNLMALESNAQEAGKMYTYKQIGNKYILSVSSLQIKANVCVCITLHR